jgi:transposase
MIHAFNRDGLATLDPHWGPGRPRRISTDEIIFLLQVAATRPKTLQLPLTHWSLRKRSAYLRGA